MRYLTEEHVLKIHKRIIDKTGGSQGVRDVDLLRSAVQRPRSTFENNNLYEGVFEKAACYLESLAKNHPFIDGNKRTSFASAVRFLDLNGYKFSASNEEVVDFVISVITEDKEVKEISEWLKKQSEAK